MQELLLINPSKRHGKKKRAKRRSNPSPAQRAARAKFAAMARARAHNPRRRRRSSAKRRSNPITVVHHARRGASRRRRNPVNSGAISFRRAIGSPLSVLKPALMGAVGAAVVNKGLSLLPLPPMLMAGRVRYFTQAVAAIGVGVIAQKLGVRGATAADMARGSLTVTMYDALRDVAAPYINLNGMGYYLPGIGVQAVPSAAGNAAQLMNGMGKYVSGPGAPNVTPIGASRVAGLRGLKGFNF